MGRFVNKLKSKKLSRVDIFCIIGVLFAFASTINAIDTRTQFGKVKVVVCGQSVDELTDKQLEDLNDLCGSPRSTPIPGPAGAPGPSGPSGQQGKPGEAAKGELAKDGHDGQDGSAGDDGVDGGSGAQGPPGPAGPRGPAGKPGKQGPQGEKGEKGDTGVGVDTQEVVDQVVQIVEADLPALIHQTVCSLVPTC